MLSGQVQAAEGTHHDQRGTEYAVAAHVGQQSCGASHLQLAREAKVARSRERLALPGEVHRAQYACFRSLAS
jgi:hypothetical protein